MPGKMLAVEQVRDIAACRPYLLFSGGTVGTAFMWPEGGGNVQIAGMVYSPQGLKRHSIHHV